MSEIAEEIAEPSMEDSLSDAFDQSEGQELLDSGYDPEKETGLETPELEPVQTAIQGEETALEEKAPVATDIKAPQSWGIPEREAWANLPPEIKAQVDKREREVNQVLQESSQARNFQGEFNQAVTPYLSLIQSQGVTPLVAFQDLMQTAATLQMAPPAQKAARIAELINHYGIDVKELDNVLSGQMPQQQEQMSPQMQQMQQQLETQNQYFQQMASQQQQYRDQSTQQTQTEVNEFVSANEFAPDVKHQMADMMEMAAKRGEAMTLEQAYKNALLIRPDIQQVIKQREQGVRANQGNEQIRLRENAASSVRQGSAGMVGGDKPTSMHDQLAAAMDGDN